MIREFYRQITGKNVNSFSIERLKQQTQNAKQK